MLHLKWSFKYIQKVRLEISRLSIFFMNSKTSRWIFQNIIFFFILLSDDQYYLVKGDIDESTCGEISCDTILAEESEVHAVRCCSDKQISDWRQSPTCSVWTESDTWGECKKLNWQDANQFCISQGGRLCTKDELEARCGEGTGCYFDSLLVWSSTTGKFIKYKKIFNILLFT